MTESRKLRVFLCHASQDKPVVRELYQRLLAEGSVSCLAQSCNKWDTYAGRNLDIHDST